jgi:serine phosphatase RsbU (regulator of sigma subunit)/pSer/pThr/pTyr-binding forkhead associated (FHA) protein
MSASTRTKSSISKTVAPCVVLHFLAGARKGGVFGIDTEGQYTFGRDPDCEIHLPDANVSRIHGQLAWDGAVLTVEDLRSTNGVYLNGEKVICQKVSTSDVVAVGSSVFRVEIAQKKRETSSADTVETHRRGTEVVSRIEPEPESDDTLKLFESMLAIQRILGQNADTMIEDSVKALFLALPVTRLSLLRVNDAGELEPWVSTTRDGVSKEFRMSRTFARKVLEADKGILIQDALALDSVEWGSTMRQQEVRTILGAPIRNRGTTVAILLCDNLEKPDILHDMHVRTIEFFGKALETVFQRNEIKRLEQSQAQADREFLAAKRVQRQIFTKKPSRQMAGYDWALYFQPALEVGGDFYDFFVVDDRISWIMADVTGKGISAALVVSMLKAFCKAIFPARLGPRKTLLELNRLIIDELPPEMFLTAILIEFDSRGKLSYANAGHNAGLVLRESGGRTRTVRLKSGGVPLGFLPPEQFAERLKEAHVSLTKGDRICLYTDGVTESANPQGAFFGEKRLLRELKQTRSLGIQAALDSLVRQIQQFQGGLHQFDDITVVIGQW